MGNEEFLKNLLTCEIRRRREANGWSQRELARRARIGKSTMISMENGRGGSIATLALVCDALGITLTIKEGQA